MLLTELIETARPLEDCLRDVRDNETSSYRWYACKGVGGCLFEVGGRMDPEGLELAAYVPRYDADGNPEAYPLNGFVHNEYRLDPYVVSFPDLNVLTREPIDMIEFLSTHDFRRWHPTYKTYTRVVRTESEGRLLNG